MKKYKINIRNLIEYADENYEFILECENLKQVLDEASKFTKGAYNINIKEIQESSNGRTAVLEAADLGSIPSS